MSPGNIGLAVFYSIISTLNFAVMSALIKSVSQYPLSQLVFFRSAIAFVVLLVVWLPRDGLRVFSTKRPIAHLTRSTFGLTSMYCYFYGYQKLPLADASALGFSLPLFIALFAPFVVNESVWLHRWAGILIGFLGMLLMVRPGGELWQMGSLVVILGTILGAFAMLTLRVLGRTEREVTTVVYFSLGCSLISSIPLFWVWQAPNTLDLMRLVGSGVAGAAGQIALVLTYTYGEASFVGASEYLRLIWAAALGYIFWAEVPSVEVIIGSIVVILSQFFIVAKERKRMAKKVGA